MAVKCMKCGRDVEEQDVFCSECLAKMEQYPVKPGTVVLLPRRREQPPLRRMHLHRKPVPTPEEQVKSLRKVIFWLGVTVVAMAVVIGILVYPAVSYWFESQEFLPGQNYSTVTEATEEVSAE